jgi:hypothetical protein
MVTKAKAVVEISEFHWNPRFSRKFWLFMLLKESEIAGAECTVSNTHGLIAAYNPTTSL